MTVNTKCVENVTGHWIKAPKNIFCGGDPVATPMVGNFSVIHFGGKSRKNFRLDVCKFTSKKGAFFSYHVRNKKKYTGDKYFVLCTVDRYRSLNVICS